MREENYGGDVPLSCWVRGQAEVLVEVATDHHQPAGRRPIPRELPDLAKLRGTALRAGSSTRLQCLKRHCDGKALKSQRGTTLCAGSRTASQADSSPHLV